MTLADYVAGRLDKNQHAKTRLEGHLKECDACNSRVTNLRANAEGHGSKVSNEKKRGGFLGFGRGKA